MRRTPAARNKGKTPLIAELTYEDLPTRRLRASSCRKFGYAIGTFKGKQAQVANYRDDKGQVVAQKLKLPGKEFVILGDFSKAEKLWGKHLWSNESRSIIITEGEIDAITVSQLQEHKYPVVSLPSGASGAKAAIEAELEWLSKFEQVVLMFDNDEAGQKAVVDVRDLFAPEQCRIATLPLKDASDMVKANRGGEVISAFFNAQPYSPDGIVAGNDVWDLITKTSSTRAVPYPWPALTTKLRGLRTSEITTICAGTGVGKSAICREIAYNLLLMGEKVGYIALEETVKRTALGLVGIGMNKPVHLNLSPSAEELAAIKIGWDAISDRVVFHDHFGSIETANLLGKIRYMVKSRKCQWIVLDHISIMVSGMDGGDERRDLDNIMTKLRSFVQETGIGLILVSHLKRPTGAGHEEGAQTSLAQLRGTAGIGQMSDVVIGAERDLQAEGEEKNITGTRVLKDRFGGSSGKAATLVYDEDTGRLSECAPADGLTEV